MQTTDRQTHSTHSTAKAQAHADRPPPPPAHQGIGRGPSQQHACSAAHLAMMISTFLFHWRPRLRPVTIPFAIAEPAHAPPRGFCRSPNVCAMRLAVKGVPVGREPLAAHACFLRSPRRCSAASRCRSSRTCVARVRPPSQGTALRPFQYHKGILSVPSDITRDCPPPLLL